VPGDEFDAQATWAIIAGVLATVIVGEILIWRAQRRGRGALPQAGGQPGVA
jgi:hypothetical protein